MRAGWYQTKLADVATVYSGSGFPNKCQGKQDQPIPFYKVSDMNLAGNEREMVFENNTISEEVRRSLGASLVPPGSTIFPKIGGAIATNKKRLTTKACCFDNNVMGVSPNVNKIDSRFLHYFFLAHDLSEFANKAALPSIKKSVVDAWKIALPRCLDEQRRIVAILDTACEAVATAKANAAENLRKSKALFASYQSTLFDTNRGGWRREKLARLTTKIGSGATPRGGEQSYKSSGIPLIRSMNVYDEGFHYDGLAFIGADQASRLDYVAVQPRDVLFNITGASVARCCVVPDELPPARVNQHVAIVRAIGEELMPEFLRYYLTAKRSKEMLLGIGASGATRQAITKAQLEDFEIWFPPKMDEQRAIVEKLDGLRESTLRLEAIFEEKMDALGRLRHSVFKGALGGQA